MIPYNPDKPIISLHIPKCGGQSFRRILQHWFKEKFFIHYYQQHNAPPPVHPLGPGTCIHGHFQRNKNLGVSDYYPQVKQFITILRDPLETAVSNYFFWKCKARSRQIELGIIEEGGEHDYRDITDFFEKRPRSHLLNFFPCDLDSYNFKEYIENHFTWIGLVENLEQSLPELAKKMGFENLPIEHINTSPRDEELPGDMATEFIENNPLEFDIFNYIKVHWSKKS